MDRRHGDNGAGRRPSMRRRISANRALGAATLANWNVTHLPRLTTFAPIFTSFSRSVVNDQYPTSYGRPHFRFGSKLPVYRGSQLCLDLGVVRTKTTGFQTFALGGPELGPFRKC